MTPGEQGFFWGVMAGCLGEVIAWAIIFGPMGYSLVQR